MSLILFWILAHDEVDVVIPGPKTLEQLNEVLDHSHSILSLNRGLPEGERPSEWTDTLRNTVGEELWLLLWNGPSCSCSTLRGGAKEL